jgi:hypothetical protein
MSPTIRQANCRNSCCQFSDVRLYIRSKKHLSKMFVHAPSVQMQIDCMTLSHAQAMKWQRTRW